MRIRYTRVENQFSEIVKSLMKSHCYLISASVFLLSKFICVFTLTYIFEFESFRVDLLQVYHIVFIASKKVTKVTAVEEVENG